jgi:hypothetical protein
MPENPFHPGERVVELAGVVQSVAIFTGAVTGAATAWLAKRSWLVSGTSLLIGAVLGFAVGLLAARIFYHSAEGMTTVVRVGSGSLPSTIRAGLAGALPTALIVASAAVFVLSAPAQSAFTTSLLCGAIIGVTFACLSSLL